MTSFPISTNTWHFINLIRSGTVIKLYLNGEYTSEWDTSISNSLLVDPDGFWIGADQDSVAGDWGEYYNGLIDEFKIWNRALTAEEIAAEYALGQ